MRARRVVRTIAFIAAVAAGLLVAFIAVAQIPAVQRALLRAALQAAGGEAVASATVGRAAGLPFGPVVVENLRLADRDGIWLTLDRLVIDWRPGGLLAGRLDIDALTVGTLDVMRPPAPAESPTAPPPGDVGLPSLPFDLNLRRLDVARIAVGEAVLGAAMAVTLDGDFQAGVDGSAAARLAMTPLDGPAGSLAIDAALAPGGDTLSLSVDYREPAGGLAARLVGRPDLPALAFSLSGEGSLADWHGRLYASAAGLVDVDGTLALARRGEALAATLAVRPILGAAAPPLLAELLGPRAALDADVVVDDGGVRVDRLALAGAAFEARGTGAFRSGNGTVAASVAVTTVGDAVWRALDLPATAATASLTANVTGSAARPVVAARFVADSMTVDEFRLGHVDLGARLEPRRDLSDSDAPIAIALDGGIEDVGSDSPELAPLLAGPLTVSLQGLARPADGRIDIAAARVAGPALNVDLTGAADIAGGTSRLRMAAMATRLPDLGLPLMLTADGHVELVADLAVDAAGTPSGPVDLKLSGIRAEPAALAALLGPSPAVSARLAGLGGDGMRLDDIRLAGAALSAEGSAAIAGRWKRLDATLEARVVRPGPALALPATLRFGGPLRARLRLEGALARPALDARVEAAAMEAGPVAVRGLVATATTGPLGAALTARIAVRADADGAPVTLDATVARGRDGIIAVDGLRLESGPTVANGRLTFDAATGLAGGAIEARTPDVARWAALAGIAAAGDLDIKMALSRDGARQTARLVARSARLALVDGPQVTAMSIDASLADPLGDAAGNIVLGAGSVTLGATTVRDPALTLSGGPRAWTLDAQGAFAGPADGKLALGGTLRPLANGASFVLSRLDGNLAGTRVGLREQGEFVIEGQRLAVRDLALSLGSGRLSLAAERAPGRIALDLTAVALPMAPAAAILGLPGVTGQLDGEATLGGTPAAPDGTFSFRLGDIAETSPGATPLPPLTATLAGRWVDGTVSVDATAQSPGTSPVSLTASLPLRLDPATLDPVVPADGAVSAAIDWQGRVEPLWELAPLDDHLLSGEATLTLRVSGPVAHPHVTGHFRLPQGRYENLLSGTLLTPLSLDVRVDDGRTALIRLEARDGASGTFAIDGTVTLDPTAGLPLAIDATLARAVVVRRDEAVATASGNVRVTGTASAPRISGTIDVESVEAVLVDRLPPSVVELPVRDADTPLAPPATDAPEGATLDLAVRAPGRIFVRGRGLESEWSGDLRLAGPAAAPTITGEVASVRGVFDFAGRDFALTGGRIVFDGGRDVDPRLDVTAEHDTGDITAIIAVRGRASAPEITISSRPPLPQDDVIAQVLFRKRSGSLSAIEALQVAQTAASLSGQGSPTGGILDRFRKALGVDVLRVDGGGGAGNGATGAGPSVAAGKYLSDRTYLGVRQGATPGSGAVSVEIELTDNLTLESEVGETGSGRTGVLWNWDY
ncbi:MAG: translocation/assembly module TamB domain-containing protein [Alphaproteobacteria bacterium]